MHACVKVRRANSCLPYFVSAQNKAREYKQDFPLGCSMSVEETVQCGHGSLIPDLSFREPTGDFRHGGSCTLHIRVMSTYGVQTFVLNRVVPRLHNPRPGQSGLFEVRYERRHEP
jgi:hypothetical protein